MINGNTSSRVFERLNCPIELARDFSSRREYNDELMNTIWNQDIPTTLCTIDTLLDYVKEDIGGDEQYRIFYSQLYSVGQDLTCEDKLDFDIIDLIIKQWEHEHSTQLSEIDRIKKKKSSPKKQQAEHDEHELINKLEIQIIQYMNKYLCVVIRSLQAVVIEEFVDCNNNNYHEGKNQYQYGNIFRPMNHITKVYNNHFFAVRNRRPILYMKLWLTHPKRRQVNTVEFIPNVTRDDDDDKHINSHHYFNHFKGLDISKRAAQQAAEFCANGADGVNCNEAVLPILNHIKIVWCNNNDELFEYVISWMATLVQKLTKMRVALVLRGNQGAGKGVIIEMLGKILGERYYFKVHDVDDVTGQFTHNLEHKFLIFMDEALCRGDKEQADTLKKLITENKHGINSKHKGSYNVDSHLNFVFSSNNDHIVQCDPIERHFMCLQLTPIHSGPQTEESKAYFDRILNVPIEVFAHYLYSRDISQFNPCSVINTPLLRDQKYRSFDAIKKWWLDVLCKESIECDDFSLSENGRHDNIRPTPSLHELAQWGDSGGDDISNGSQWRAPYYKDYIYGSYKEYVIANNSNNNKRTTIISTTEFWKEFKSIVPPFSQDKIDEQKVFEKPYHRGAKLPVLSIVYFPSVDVCRDYWRRVVVADAEWPFAINSE